MRHIQGTDGTYATVIEDEAGNPIEATEYDKDGNVLERTYFSAGQPSDAQAPSQSEPA